ncbi:UNVERIFIED_CONTAM: moxd1 [Trichonephila clavipes]
MNIEISYYLFLFTLSFSCFSALAEEWMHCTVLDGERKFHVCWNLIESADDDREIEFKVEVETHGYVGFGLSPNGGMAGSDIVTGWIKEDFLQFGDPTFCKPGRIDVLIGWYWVFQILKNDAFKINSPMNK